MNKHVLFPSFIHVNERQSIKLIISICICIYIHISNSEDYDDGWIIFRYILFFFICTFVYTYIHVKMVIMLC